jgi:hypothetical protein
MVQSNSLFLFSYGDKDKETKKLNNKFVIQNMAPTCINYWKLHCGFLDISSQLFPIENCIVASLTLLKMAFVLSVSPPILLFNVLTRYQYIHHFSL